MTDRGTIARQVALLLVAFIATFVLLVGGRELLGRSPADGAGHSPSPGEPREPGGSLGFSPAPTGGPSADASASGEPTIVLTGAGDIADCTLPGAAKTSDLLLAQGGSFFTAGDNAYEDGSTANYTECYGPTWGRVLGRTTLPAAGNHDWQTPGAAGYLAYFGTVADPHGVTWYSADLGA